MDSAHFLIIANAVNSSAITSILIQMHRLRVLKPLRAACQCTRQTTSFSIFKNKYSLESTRLSTLVVL